MLTTAAVSFQPSRRNDNEKSNVFYTLNVTKM